MAAEKIGLEAVLDLGKFNLAYSSYIGKLNSMNAITGSTAGSLSNQFTNFGQSLLKVAAILSGAIVAGATVAAAALTKLTVNSIKEAAELEQQIANIASTMNMTTKEAGFLNDVIIDLGLDPQLRVTTFEAAEAMDLLAKNGIFAGLSIQQMETTAREAGKAVVLLANATGADFGQAANIATDAMVLFNRNSGDLVDIVSNITGVTTNSKFTINDYEVALRNGGAAAAIAGVSLEEFNTIVAASAEELGTGMKAGTGILNFMNRLTPNTEKATNAMKDLGIVTADGTNRFFDANGELKSMAEVSAILNQALFGTTKVVSEVSNRTAEQNALLADLNAEYNDAKQTIDDYTNGVAGLLATEDEKNAAIAEAQDIIDKLTPKMAELNAVDSTYVETLQQLTTEQRMVALETIFGNDAMKTAIAVGKEGQVVTGDLARVTRAFGVSWQEAAVMVENGLTEYELLMREIENTDAVENAETRMDTLMGKIEILGGIVEAFRIKFGSQFLDLFTKIAEKAQEFADNEDFGKFIENLGSGLSNLIGSLLDGEPALESFKNFLTDIGQGDLATRLQDIVTSVENFVTPIVEFVQQHSDAFIGALKGIGIALAGIMGFTVLAGILSALLSPVGLLIIAAGLLGAAWESNFMNIQEVTRNVVSTVTGFLENIGVIDFIDDLKAAFDAGGLKGVANEIPKALSKLGENIKTSVTDWFTGIDWAETARTLVEDLMSAMRSAGEGLGNLINIFTEWVLSVDWENVGGLIIDSIIAAIAFSVVRFAAIGQFLISAFETIDWESVALALIKFVGGIVVGAFERLGEVLGDLGSIFYESVISPMLSSLNTRGDEVAKSFNQWFYGGLLKAIAYLQENIVEPLNGIFETFTTWVEGITWEDIGYWITTAFLNVFVAFPLSIVETLATWWQAFYNWFTTTDWESLASDLITRIDTTLKTFWSLAKITLESWWTSIKGWFTETDWESQGQSVTDRIDEQLKKFWLTAKGTFDNWWEDIKKWFDEIDWGQLGRNVVDGFINGLNSKLGDIKDAVRGLASGAKQAWDDFWNSHSPSRLMMESGVDIMKGAEIGMEKQAMRAMETVSTIGSELFSGFNQSIENVLPNAPAQRVPAPVTTQKTYEYNVNNDFLGDPQITDANSLKMILSGFA